jgi:hypothetical protein
LIKTNYKTNNPMNPQEFAYWLKGFFELTDQKALNETQVQIIKEHLDLVFDKKTITSMGFSGTCGISEVSL